MSAQDTVLNGRYRLLQQQGAGGMAVVYKAHDLALGRTVAIKILRPSLTGDPAFLTRFRQEARNVANLAHPNIVTLHDFGQDGNTYYMVMEFIDGQDLKKLIRASAPFPIPRALNIAIQICAGIGYAHRAGLIHADVKPQNILMTGNDIVKVTDFGIAQALASTQNQERQTVVWGSPHYFAPEQASGDPPSPASDVYSIGVVVYEMLTGKLPYNGGDQQELALAHIREAIPHVQTLNPGVPVHLDRLIYKVMSKTPADRYRTAEQLGRILIEYQKEGSQYTGATPIPPAAANSQPIPSPAAATPLSNSAVRPVPIRGNTPGSTPSAPIPATGSAPSPIPPIGSTPPGGVSVPAPVAGGTPSQPGVPIVNATPIPSSQPVVRQAPRQPQAPATPQSVGQGAGQLPGQTPNPYAPPPQNNNLYDPYAPPGQRGNAGVFTATYDTGTGAYRDDPQYSIPNARRGVDVISIILGIIAFLAVAGLFVLAIAVFNAYR